MTSALERDNSMKRGHELSEIRHISYRLDSAPSARRGAGAVLRGGRESAPGPSTSLRTL